MLSVVIAAQDSERALLPTLAALVPGAVDGVVREVIVADGGSRDGSATIAEGAGCRVLISGGARGARLKAAADIARAPWLMFLRPGTVPDATWIDDVRRFVEEAELRGRAASSAAVFRAGSARFLADSGVDLTPLDEVAQVWEAQARTVLRVAVDGRAVGALALADAIKPHAREAIEAVRRTGAEVWRAKGIRESWNTPVVIAADSGRQELVLAIHGSVLAFEPETGKPLWSCQTDIGWYMVPSVVAAG